MEPRVVFDFHSHILPGVDHGAADVEESLSILKAAKSVGIEYIAATPHFYPHRHRVSDFVRCRDAAFAQLQTQVQQMDLPKILPGAEVLLCPGLDRMAGLEQLCLRDTNVLLLELPFVSDEHTDEMYDTVERLLTERHYIVYVAHPNRYPDDTIDRMLEMSVRLQLNVEDLVCFRERKRIKRWIQSGRVHAIGSDVHHHLQIYKQWSKAVPSVAPILDFVNHPLRGARHREKAEISPGNG